MTGGEKKKRKREQREEEEEEVEEVEEGTREGESRKTEGGREMLQRERGKKRDDRREGTKGSG